jgi:hypothetical protein
MAKPLSMTLDAYLSRDGAKTLTALSIEMAVSKGRLSQLRNAKEWPPELAMKAESATDGALDAATLSRVVAQARQGLAA